MHSYVKKNNTYSHCLDSSKIGLSFESGDFYEWAGIVSTYDKFSVACFPVIFPCEWYLLYDENYSVSVPRMLS